MVLLVQKLGRSLKFHSKLEDHHNLSSEALSASLREFRSSISIFLNQILLKPDPELEFFSLSWFHKCFELINISNRAFAKFVVEINYPMSKWGEKATEEYLNYSLNLLGILNSISSSLSHLSHAKISISHSLEQSNLKKISGECPGKGLKLENSNIGIIEGLTSSSSRSGSEFVVLEALMILKRIGFLSLGLVLSGLCSYAKPYMDIRRFVGGFDDSLVKGIDSRFCKEVTEMKGVVEEVKDVNDAVERLSVAKSDGGLKELRRRLEVLGNSIEGIEKLANNMFSEVLATRNKLVDNLRLGGKNHH